MGRSKKKQKVREMKDTGGGKGAETTTWKI